MRRLVLRRLLLIGACIAIPGGWGLLFEAPARGQATEPWKAPYRGPSRSDVDASTLHKKVLCGYQGWFRCPGDPAGQGWRHWSLHGDRIDVKSLTFEMWPDLSEFPERETYPATGFVAKDGKVASLFSSVDRGTVDRHFAWMQKYGIDGVFAQRFLVNVGDRSFDRVLGQVRDAANRTGRVFAVCYDLTGEREDRIVDRLLSDWKSLVQEWQLTKDARYLHHEGRPVLFVWGLDPAHLKADAAHRLVDELRAAGPITLIGGCPWGWRSVRDPKWARLYRRLDVISPWNVGNYSRINGQRQASTGYWRADLDEARKAGVAYLPTIYPGFGWTNLKGPKAESATIPRLGGAFFWRQFATAAELKIDMAYVAMFDEVDEGTAIFKVTNAPPTPSHFQTYEGLPSDWYLKLTGEGTRLLRGERPEGGAMPRVP